MDQVLVLPGPSKNLESILRFLEQVTKLLKKRCYKKQYQNPGF